MIAKINTMSLYGIQALPVTVEVQITRGLHRQITGLPDQAVRETMDRMPDILSCLGFRMPRTRLAIHLSPGGLPKKGNAFDLPILLGILLASGQINDQGKANGYVFAGEVTLDGTIKPVRGALAMAQKAKRQGYKGIILPIHNGNEGSLIDGLTIYGVRHVKEVFDFLKTDGALQAFQPASLRTIAPEQPQLDFKEVIGQSNLCRAMEIAAAGGHHTLMIGPPGVGKSLVAKRLPSIMPPMTRPEILETTLIYSAHHQSVKRLIGERPFRTIHHTISEVGLAGGGPEASPGEITLAHHGVLFMDELALFKPSVLEALRQPLEEGMITVARHKAIIQYPASFMLIAAMNPCLCGYHNHPVRKCTCSKHALYGYQRKISGPFLDRFDLQVQAETVSVYECTQPQTREDSAAIGKRVARARNLQSIRFASQKGVYCNAQMPDNMQAIHGELEAHARKYLFDRMEKWQLSVRASCKILKVARTIADLSGQPRIELEHVAEAIHFRALDHSLSVATKQISSTIQVKYNRYEHIL